MWCALPFKPSSIAVHIGHAFAIFGPYMKL
jgi:hypothetical protein